MLKEVRLQSRNEVDKKLVAALEKRSRKTGVMPTELLRQAVRRGLDEMQRDDELIAEGRKARV